MNTTTKFFKAISDPTRQKILVALRKRGELNVGDIQGVIALSQPTASQHLKVLSEAGIVKTLRRGQKIYYSLCNKVIYDVISKFMKDYEPKKK